MTFVAGKNDVFEDWNNVINNLSFPHIHLFIIIYSRIDSVEKRKGWVFDVAVDTRGTA